MKYRVIIEKDENGFFVAEATNLPGCISQGTTRAEAIENIKEAIELYLESLAARDEPVPPPIAEEIITPATLCINLSCALAPVVSPALNAGLHRANQVPVLPVGVLLF